MKFIVCVDVNNGLMFNKRRVSKDEVVLLDMISSVDKLYMNEYSKKMFSDYSLEDDVIVSDDYSNEYYFIEDDSLKQYEDNIEEIVVYNWNREYPSDLKLDVNLSGFSIKEEKIIEGNSHEEIIKIVYVRKGV